MNAETTPSSGDAARPADISSGGAGLPVFLHAGGGVA